MTAARTGGLPMVEATREAERHRGTIVWVVRRCAYCHRRHTHVADPQLTAVVIPARCNQSLFYRLQEVPGGSAAA
ncbi:hypothetical protein P1P68_12685 [Streptomyces scabiei]|uniref:hypothetical protein n=1 Tax=Streptomyces scabiei TaxID=1930 RepID=UPI00298F95AF|nr:hypothetical protein [Streptomyces scabiei]MDW8805615.1 hypothetical protein [Streptomyces scabiei]